MQQPVKATDVGRVRDHNEDACLVAPVPGGLVLAVADGMGGHAAGEVASGLAIEGLQRAVDRIRGPGAALGILQDEVERAHQAIRAAAQGEREGMGCTLTVAALWPGQVEILQIGDSRAYCYDDTGLVQLTEDDSLVGEMVRANILSAAAARHHPARSVLTRALGIGPHADCQAVIRPVADGQLLLLCSDGLTSMLDDAAIAARLAAGGDLEALAQGLVAAANEAGGSDNITVVLAPCRGGGPS